MRLPGYGFLLCLFFFLAAFRFDAAVEGFLIEAKNIHPNVLSDTKGILTVTFSELDYYVGIKMEPAKLLMHMYTDSTGYQPLTGFVTVDNSKAVSGIDYSNMIIRRFPVKTVDGPMIQIIYDVHKNHRTWISITDGSYARTSVGQLIPARLTGFEPARNLDLSYDVFYLLNGKPRIFYQTPDESSAKVSIPDAESFQLIPWRAQKEAVSSITVTEIENGFAKLYTREGADGELLFSGWVKIYVGGKLSIWEFETRGC